MSQVGAAIPTPAASSAPKRLDGRSIGIAVIVSLVFPPVLLYAAWRTTSERQRHWLLTLFVVYFGATLPIIYDGSRAGPDGVRHLLQVHEYYATLSVEQFMADLGDIMMLRGAQGSSDPYKHVLSFFTGRVLGAPGLFFPLVALVYGYVFVGSMLIIFRNLGRSRLSIVVVVLALIFFLTRNIESMQAVRNPTAMWVLVYGTLRFLEARSVRHVLLVASTPLIHFSYLAIAAPALIFAVIGTRRTLYIVLFVMSGLVDIVTPSAILDVIPDEVGVGGQRLRGGGGWFDERTELDDRLGAFDQSVESGTRFWRAYALAGFSTVALDILVYGLILSGAYYGMARYPAGVFSAGLVLVSASKFLWFVPGVGRMWAPGFTLIMAGFLIWRLAPASTRTFRFAKWPYSVAALVSSVIFAPQILFSLSRLLDFVSPYVLAAPFIVVAMPDVNITAKELLRMVLLL